MNKFEFQFVKGQLSRPKGKEFPTFAVPYGVRKEDLLMMDTDFFQILFMHLEERNIYQNLKQDKEYLNATEEETKLCRPFENLTLSEVQQNIIK